ncbi:MAG: hypothetical protein ACFFG0_55955 [Candidatus Thorarchaeota archaeon]
MPENITIKSNCPICNKSIIFDLDEKFILNSEQFPVQFLIEHCNQSLIAYVDKDFEIKGIESVSNIFKNKDQFKKYHIQGEPITPEFIQKMTLEEKFILSSNYDFNYLKKQQFPNVIEKQILLQISKYNEISIGVLLQKLSILSKALNRTIDQDSLLEIVDKYVKKGLINKDFIKFGKKKSDFNDLKIDLRGDLI